MSSKRGITRGIFGPLLIAAALCVRSEAGSSQVTTSPGQQAFQAHRWLDALAFFLETLRQDPKNVEAHRYIPLAIKEIEAQNHAVVREMRLNMLNESSDRLEGYRLNAAPIKTAVADASHVEQRARDDRWTRWLEEAKVGRQLGHLLVANDLLLRIIAEKPGHPGAQQDLSLLQAEIRQALVTNTDLLVQERYALEGFYAYSQADLPAAASAWAKARAIVEQTYPPPQAAQQLVSLHFGEYAKLAEADVAEKTKEAKIQAMFARGVQLYQKRQFAQALDTFRQVAFAKPEYPQLAFYLVHAETGAEQERTRKLSEAKRQEVAALLEKGVGSMEHEQYADAQDAFQQVLALDGTNPSAKSYLTVIQAEVQRRHDPKTAQAHYEAGLIAYASGKLDEAAREWRIANRMDPQNEKAVNALSRVQKELAFSKELP
jgi:hypothetical protein